MSPMADDESHGGLIRQPYEVAALLLDDMNNVNREWHNSEERVPTLQVILSKDYINRDHDRDETHGQNDDPNRFIIRACLRGGTKFVNAVGTNSGHVHRAYARYGDMANTFGDVMARTKGKNVVSSATESNKDSSPPPSLQKKQKGHSIDEPSKASNAKKPNSKHLKEGIK
uniref:Uncharacterized protein n=1 Tax=Solanum tuberosum TaxID=4113 RepID=M1DUW4_SOLTU